MDLVAFSGDGLFHLAVKLFGVVNEERAPLAAGLVLGRRSVQMSGRAIGFEPETVVKSVLASLATAWRRALDEARTPAEPVEHRQTMPDDGAGRFGWPWSRTAKVAHADIRLSDRRAVRCTVAQRPTSCQPWRLDTARDIGLEVSHEVGAGAAAQRR